MADIVHVTSEVVPFSKTGGLADVSAALPAALARRGHRVAVVTPLHGSVDRARHGVRSTARTFPVTLDGTTRTFRVHEAVLPGGVPVTLLECDELFGRPELYGTRDGEYPDNAMRFAFFAAAALRVPGLDGHRPDVWHGHDWQAGLVPLFNRFADPHAAASVSTVHNLAYQGTFPADQLPATGIPWSLFHPDGVEFWGRFSLLKAGLVYADAVTTVSPTYAREVLEPEGGMGMDGVLRWLGSRFHGILNGADYEAWSPDRDPHLAAHYSAADLSGKAACRAALLEEFGLPEPNGPLFGVVGRFTWQKGYDLLAGSLDDLVAGGGSIVLLGSGDREVEDALVAAAARHPGRVGLRVAYDDGLAHRIEAGADFFVMPSRFEPCGLNQIYSLRYGTLPVVHAVGGLEDTVRDVDDEPERGTGIKFRGFEREALVEALRRARALWDERDRHRATMVRAMGEDFGWDASARAYEDLYARIIH